jgi:hypothetical protein
MLVSLPLLQNEVIVHLRFKQMRNYLVALMMAVGTPMMVMGECLTLRTLTGRGWGACGGGCRHRAVQAAEQLKHYYPAHRQGYIS